MADNATPAPAPTAAPAPALNPQINVAPGSAQAPAIDFIQSLPEDRRAYAQNKGWKDSSQLLESYVNFEKLHGVPQERMLKLPEKMEGPEARAVYERLGAPKEKKDYQISADNMGGDAQVAEAITDAFFETGVTKVAADRILAKLAEHGKATQTAKAEAQKAKFSTEDAQLKQEWGTAYDQNRQIAVQGAQAMGFKEKEVDAIASALGHKATMLLMKKLGSATGEAQYVTGKPTNGILEPNAAKMKMKELMGDKTFGDRLMNGDSDAKNTWTNLAKMAAPGQTSF